MTFNGQILELIGEGSRRACYRLGKTGLCVKFYRRPEDCVAPKMKPSVIRELRRRRFNRRANVCAQEVDLLARLGPKLPPVVREMLPETMELVKHPLWGWGSVQPYLTNPDGSTIIPAELEMWHHAQERDFVLRMYRCVRDCLDLIVPSALPFYEASNLFVWWQADGSMKLKIIDFEPTSKTLISPERFCPWLRRRMMRRKADDYLAYLRMAFKIKEEEVAV